eukprot:gnl/TRDRNA2_/TRDRNA2_197863_c0_seq1.p1 gnl/TRDRNA2_/TRDRNA2_197863_c0~~gnl/TRDRNA2_/TRDRNA2_197863_c0_seq1.p1  ORF type:complete len:276 (-),score=56.62 gnl/TRDRNA2_/TRDRNA2_197863_c0_seq1:56-883(-)
MRSDAVIRLFSFVALAHAKEASEVADTMQGKVAERMLQSWGPRLIAFDSTMLAKGRRSANCEGCSSCSSAGSRRLSTASAADSRLTSTSKKDCCAFCFGNLENLKEANVERMPCGHGMHKSCAQWFIELEYRQSLMPENMGDVPYPEDYDQRMKDEGYADENDEDGGGRRINRPHRDLLKSKTGELTAAVKSIDISKDDSEQVDVDALFGTLSRWSVEKGFGFVKPEDGSEDLFCQAKSLVDGEGSVSQGDAVTFIKKWNELKGKHEAVNIRKRA